LCAWSSPITVIDELDNKKSARREKFQQHNRALLTLIDRYEPTAPDACLQLCAEVTFGAFPDEPTVCEITGH